MKNPSKAGAASLLNALRNSARQSPRLIGPNAGTRTRDYVLSRQVANGGFRGRSDAPDLYYTAFALLCLDALDAAPAAQGISDYLHQQTIRDDLDLIHAACLARSLALTGHHGDESILRSVIENYRTPDGGFSEKEGASTGTAYGAYMALSALDDLGMYDARDEGVLRSLQILRRTGGGFANEADNPQPATNATAGATAVLARMNVASVKSAAESLLAAQHEVGGFIANPVAPAPDLLSTATALHALGALGVADGIDGEKNLNFAESLCADDGGFAGHWADDVTDVEYTFYGLLAIGELVSLAEGLIAD